jgi:hypothetical protein
MMSSTGNNEDPGGTPIQGVTGDDQTHDQHGDTPGVTTPSAHAFFGHGVAAGTVTHWRPLPASPEVAGRGGGAAVIDESSLLTHEAIVRRLSDAHARRIGPSILLSSILADHGGCILLAVQAECTLAATAVQHGLRIEVSAEGWRVNGGPAWPTLDEAITGRAAKPAPPAAARATSTAVAAQADDDDEPLPF